MTGWEKKITDAFIGHYFNSLPETGEDRRTLRLRSSLFFPDFAAVHPDEKESYLEAAELLERKGIIKISWEKHGKGEQLKTLSCNNLEKLFEEAGKPYPETEAEKTRDILGKKTAAIKETLTAANSNNAPAVKKVLAILEFFSLCFGPREIGQGMDLNTMEQLVKLLEFSCEPAQLENITIRALSILLYRDSKYLENLLAVCKPLLSRAQKTVALPDIFFLERSYPETMISGKIVIEYKNLKPPMVNAGGYILNLPLENTEAIVSLHPVSDKREKTVLTIENKETFYALGSPQKHGAGNLSCYDCFLYTGGYPNRAAAALIKVLSSSGFSFFHAGDLDPDGICILQTIQDIAEKPVTPVRMDAATFDQYRPWARSLTKSMLNQIKKIKKETITIEGLATLLQRIEETGLGVEQEIIDYR
ncbi:MAG: DUF2220 family protein [Treponema sp.]|nr:DUF2220 family protein [Treponema sp.]